MPWFVGPFSSQASYLAGIFACFGFIKACSEIVGRNGRVIVGCFVLWATGLCLTLGQLDYLLELRSHCGLSEIWSGLEPLPEEAIKINETYRYSHFGVCHNNCVRYPDKFEVDLNVLAVKWRFLILSLSGIYLLAVAFKRNKLSGGDLELRDYFSGAPSQILGLAGMVTMVFTYILGLIGFP